MKNKMKNNILKLYYCDNCKYHTKNSSNFKRHLLSNTHINNEKKFNKTIEMKKINMYPCAECETMYKSRNSWSHHQKRYHDPNIIAMKNAEIMIEKLKNDIEILKKDKLNVETSKSKSKNKTKTTQNIPHSLRTQVWNKWIGKKQAQQNVYVVKSMK